jgi:hypothetical protein
MDARMATRKSLVESWQEVTASNGRKMYMDESGEYVVEGQKNGSTVTYYWGRSFTQADTHLMKGVEDGR